MRAGYLRLQTHNQTLQQRLHERISALRYAYIVCLAPHTFCCVKNPVLLHLKPVLLHLKPSAKTLPYTNEAGRSGCKSRCLNS